MPLTETAPTEQFPAVQVFRRQCRRAGWNMIFGMIAAMKAWHKAPLAPDFCVRWYSLFLRRCWQRKRAFRYLDLSLFLISGADGKSLGARSDPALRRSCSDKCGWPFGAAPVAPDADTHHCGRAVLDHRGGRCKRRRCIPGLDRSSGGTLLAGRHCLPEGRTRQQARIMAGYDSGSGAMIGTAPFQAPIAGGGWGLSFLSASGVQE